MPRYALSKAAANDLQSIARYTVKNFGAVKAKAYGAGITSCFDIIADNLQIDRVFDRIRPGLRRYDHKSHAIFYIQTDQGVLIVRVLHISQDTQRHL